MTGTDFFTDQTQQSRTKARIVSKYFGGWARVVGPAAKRHGEVIQYLDLFSGPGCYEDGSESTPILVLRQAIANASLHDVFVSKFNDADPAAAERLRQTIDALPGIGFLKHKPKVSSEPVDDQIAEMLERTTLPPTLTFVDPFGYKGLSVRLIRAAFKDWGCDCIFFFNFNRVNAAIHNEDVEQHILRLFDTEDARPLRERLLGMRPAEREARVMEELTTALKRDASLHVLHFAFLNDAASRTSHHLVFVTKHPLGCKIMKDIMAKESSWVEDGLPSFVCSPKAKEPTLFDDIDDPIAELQRMLLETFAGAKLPVGTIYEEHGLDSRRRFMPPHYKEALKRLEAEGRVLATPPASERRQGTMADHVVIEFPERTG
jgi:three-Cys-motif partner protein